MRVLTVAAGILLFGCAAPAPSPGYESVILPPDPSTPGGWTPSLEQTREFAAALPARLARSTDERTREIAPLDEYVCQYTGITVDGRRAIHANFLSRDGLLELGGRGTRFIDIWKTGSIGIDGGGPQTCFRAIYLVEDRTFAAIHPNADR